MARSTSLPKLAGSFVMVVFIGIGLSLTVKAEPVPLAALLTDQNITTYPVYPASVKSAALFQNSTMKIEFMAATKASEPLTLTHMPLSGTDVKSVSECGDSDSDSDSEPCGGQVATPVPEPASLLLMGTGLMGIAAGVRRRLASKR